MKELLKLILPKVMSGRYYLTLIGGVSFLYCVWKKTLEPQAIASIITAIFLSYFNRHDRPANGGQR